MASLSYNDANNRITTPGFEYDPAGNQTRAVIDASGTQQQYRYDCANRLVQVLDASGNVLATHAYGASNQRLKSVEGGVTKYFAWAGGQIVAEYEASGANALVWKTSYVYLGGRLLATTSGTDETGTRFHHPDRLGTRLVTATDGTVVSEQWTMPFGTMQPFTSVPGGENPYRNPTLSNPSKKRFTSYDRSDVTSLDYAVNRFYSPQQGRFTQVDPIGMSAASLGNPQTLNMYAYCGNDPINHVDPDGLFIRGTIINSTISVGGRIIHRIIIVIGDVLSAGRGGSSRQSARTPPTFGKPPSISLGGILGGILGKIPRSIGVNVDARTPPFGGGGYGVGAVSNFLGQDPKREEYVTIWAPWEVSGFYELLDLVSRRKIKPLTGGKGQRVQCAQLPQRWHERDGGSPRPTSGWSRGPSVMASSRANNIEPGTVVATFLGQDYYPNRSGGNHVGIYVSGDDNGFWMVEQGQGPSGGWINMRYIEASPVTPGDYSDYFTNANQYSVVMVPLTGSIPNCRCDGDTCRPANRR